MPLPSATHPDWDRLFETATAQEGLFTTRQAMDAGYSPQLLVHYVKSGRVVRVRRGIYRLVHFPPGEHEEIVTAWLWSGRTGVVSHQTALMLHGLSDALPAKVHLTVPASWRQRRLRVPAGVVLHFDDVPDADRTWFDAVRTTTVRRTLADCAHGGLAPDLLRQAALGALERGLVARRDLRAVETALAPFGGLAR